MSINEKNEVCPCCGRHCPADDLHCPRGRAHFGLENSESHEEHGGHNHGYDNANMTIDDKVITMLRKCGHHLHHNVSRDGTDNGQLLNFLSEDEKKQIIGLLKKCLQGWDNEKHQ